MEVERASVTAARPDRSEAVVGEHNPLPGAVGISLLRVYSEPSLDGVVGGTPHVHLVCSEGYYVVSGAGAVHTLTRSGPSVVPLHAGAVAWFTPGTVHRLENHGGLEIVTLMQNSGLPEAGDAVLTMPRAVLTDPQEYDRQARLRPDATLQDAYLRRDLAVRGLEELREAVDRDGPDALEWFYRAAREIVRPRLQRWRALWSAGAHRAALTTSEQLDLLEAGDVGYLGDAVVERRPGPLETGRLGMCGLLETYSATTA
jgi:mannose-6-phosphate isomerase-like protein (cupin superfamily)